jgi:hypothetical protein
LVVVVVPCTTACKAGRLGAGRGQRRHEADRLVVDGGRHLGELDCAETESIASRSVKVPPTSMPTVRDFWTRT